MMWPQPGGLAMFGYCTTLSPLGWLLMVLLWTGVFAGAVWGISRLFPSPGKREHGRFANAQPGAVIEDSAVRGERAPGFVGDAHERERV